MCEGRQAYASVSGTAYGKSGVPNLPVSKIVIMNRRFAVKSKKVSFVVLQSNKSMLIT